MSSVLIDLEAGLVDTLEFSNPEALVIEADTVTLLGGNIAEDRQCRAGHCNRWRRARAH